MWCGVHKRRKLKNLSSCCMFIFSFIDCLGLKVVVPTLEMISQGKDNGAEGEKPE